MSESYDFWLVWNPGGNNPSFRHTSELSATNEAERLARIQRGTPFYVLHAISVSQVEPEPSITKKLLDMPF